MGNDVSVQSLTDNHAAKTYEDFKTNCNCDIQHVAAKMTCRGKSNG